MDHQRKIRIMGIVNLTDDSYFAPSRTLGKDGVADLAKTLDRIGKMLSEGANIIDLGACSTRPGAVAIGATAEWKRLSPVLELLPKEFPGIRISVDTYWSEIVRRTHDVVGDFIVNDISAGEDDTEMLPTVGKLGLEYIAMHKRGNPVTMGGLCDYPPSPVEDLSPVSHAVSSYFKDFAVKAKSHGIKNWIMDPGFGFAKTVEQNWELLDELSKIIIPQHQTLVGVSRKSMIWKRFGITPEESLAATEVLQLEALQRGADILRVHDVAEASRTVEIYQRLG